MTPAEPAKKHHYGSAEPRRGGAPKGNRNAVKHGKYVGGRHLVDRAAQKRLRKKYAADSKLLRRLERDAKAIARGRVVQSHDTDPLVNAEWDGKDLRKYLLGVAKNLDEYSKTVFWENEFKFHHACAGRDVFRLLCSEPKWFASYKMFLKGICSVFLQIEEIIARADVPGVPNRWVYRNYWRLHCAGLYERCCPDKCVGAPSTQRGSGRLCADVILRRSPEDQDGQALAEGVIVEEQFAVWLGRNIRRKPAA